MNVRVDWRVSLALVGTVLRYLTVAFVVPLVVALYYGESVLPFVVAAAVSGVAGVGLERLGDPENFGGREAFLMVVLSWFGIGVVAAIPFLVAGEGVVAHPVNAFFEATSGVTTTGATVMNDISFETHTRSVLMWRQLTQWLGGLGILVLATAVLSELSVGGAQLMETETQTQDVNKLTPRIEETARLILKLYLAVTVAQTALLYSLNIVGFADEMTLYNAVAHAFTSVSTAGFSPEARSIEAFSPAVQWATIPGMFVGATSFVLIYHLTQGDTSRLKRSEEFRFYVFVLSAFIVASAAILVSEGTHSSFEENVRHAVFNVTSILTTTGYASTDFNLWSSSVKHLLFLCMFFGGMAGSTTCSIKMVRWLVVAKGFRRDLFKAVHPDAVRPVRLSGNVVDEEAIRDIYAFVLVSLVAFFALTVFVAVDSARAGVGIDEFEAMSASAATFFNIGPAFGIAGPMESYDVFSNATKVAMTVMMWVGRIEIIPVLVILTPAYWRS
ncbi:MAG: TrkH family potassium uptake protein [Halobacteriales archaeon]|nr:TrkH family potassium uptake protein [Halobacteriales archaeon]